jgi:hypothetical protein
MKRLRVFTISYELHRKAVKRDSLVPNGTGFELIGIPAFIQKLSQHMQAMRSSWEVNA